MAVKMRVAKDKKECCHSCGNNIENSVEMFDMAFQVPGQKPTIIHICDRCVSEVMDKTLKARCMVDGMLKSPKQIRIINGRKQAESKKKYQ